jgi:peptidyl-prolyl cis-trans isomerase A (cyclophilin A)
MTRNALAAAVALAAATFTALPTWAQNVRLATSQGDIVISVDSTAAPGTVENFLTYVRAGHYDGIIFHRVIDGFMIQTGGYRADLSQKATRKPIALESRNGLSNQPYTVAMARTGDPDSATSQFFINVADNSRLDAANARDGNGYAVFGRVVEGQDVVDKIRAIPTAPKGEHQNLPTTTVTIRKATIER